MSENRVAVISIIVEDRSSASQINALLSEFADYIVGRMGVPYKCKNISVMCVIADAPAEVLNTITGKIGMLSGVTAKTLMRHLILCTTNILTWLNLLTRWEPQKNFIIL